MAKIEADHPQPPNTEGGKKYYLPQTTVTVGNLLAATTDSRAKKILEEGAPKTGSKTERKRLTRLSASFESMFKDSLQTPGEIPDIVTIQGQLHLQTRKEAKERIYGDKNFIKTLFLKIMDWRNYLVKHKVNSLRVNGEDIDLNASNFRQLALKIGLNQWLSQAKEANGGLESASRRPKGRHSNPNQSAKLLQE